MGWKSKVPNYGLLLGNYLLLLIISWLAFPTIERWGSHMARCFMGGWIFWFIGPVWWRVPLFRINPLALLIYHTLFLIGFSFATRRMKRFWHPAALLYPIAWFVGYLLALFQGGPGVIAQFIDGYYP